MSQFSSYQDLSQHNLFFMQHWYQREKVLVAFHIILFLTSCISHGQKIKRKNKPNRFHKKETDSQVEKHLLFLLEIFFKLQLYLLFVAMS